MRTLPAVEHHVGGFQVAMKNPLVRRRVYAELARDVDRLVLRNAADPKQRGEILAVIYSS
jgi:hypothetical protein